MMWDYGVRIPLRDAEGLLPEEPEWLREALGLSERLIEDLGRWGLDMNELDADPRRRTREAYEALDVRGRELAHRLQQEGRAPGQPEVPPVVTAPTHAELDERLDTTSRWHQSNRRRNARPRR